MLKTKTGLGLMTKIKLGAVGVLVLLVLLVVTMCSQQRASTQAVDEAQQQEQARPGNDTEKGEDGEIERIVAEDGEVMEIPNDAVVAAVEENVAEFQKPKDGEVEAYDCRGDRNGEGISDTTIPVPAEVGTKVRCQLRMTTSYGSEVDQNQIGWVTSFESDDPSSVRIQF